MTIIFEELLTPAEALDAALSNHLPSRIQAHLFLHGPLVWYGPQDPDTHQAKM